MLPKQNEDGEEIARLNLIRLFPPLFWRHGHLNSNVWAGPGQRDYKRLITHERRDEEKELGWMTSKRF